MPFDFDATALPQDEHEAERRFASTCSHDPFPEIPPALLNTADLLDYVVATGMLFPFDVDLGDPSESLKPASCGIRLLGEVRYWQEGKNEGDSPTPIRRTLTRGQHLAIERNSIVYVTLAPTFRMPDYLAARFNLTIRDVYRGILLGTGPLVDPGFQGKLSVPLHNLTYNDYTLVGGEILVWMEFTKLSPHPDWESSAVRAPSRRGAFVGFPGRKLNRKTVDDYLEWASPGKPIRSSIPALAGEAAKSAERASSEAARIRNVSYGVAIGIALALVGILLAVYQTFNEISSDRRDLRDQVLVLRQGLSDTQDEAQRLRVRLRALERRSP